MLPAWPVVLLDDVLLFFSKIKHTIPMLYLYVWWSLCEYSSLFFSSFIFRYMRWQWGWFSGTLFQVRSKNRCIDSKSRIKNSGWKSEQAVMFIKMKDDVAQCEYCSCLEESYINAQCSLTLNDMDCTITPSRQRVVRWRFLLRADILDMYAS